MTLELRWWEYLLMALSIFIGSLFLNFFVKKINEARLEERFIRLQKKNSIDRSTQVQESFPVEPIPIKDNQSVYSGNPGISFVYNKEENLKNNRDTNSNISTESSKESSKLKFLGTIYHARGVFIDNDNINDNRKNTTAIEIEFPDVQTNEIKEWISDLLVNNVLNKVIDNYSQ